MKVREIEPSCLILMFLAFISLASASGFDIILKRGTIIKFRDLNCSLIVGENYHVNKMWVYPHYFLINMSADPSYLTNASYHYNSSSKLINISCVPDSSRVLIINTSKLDGIRIEKVPLSTFITFLEYNNLTKILKFNLTGMGYNKTVNIFYNLTQNFNIIDDYYSTHLPVIEVRSGKVTTKRGMYLANLTDSLLVFKIPVMSEHMITLFPSKPDGQSCLWDFECTSNVCCHNTCRPACPYCGDGYCDKGEDCWNCASDCGLCRPPREYVYSLEVRAPDEIMIHFNETKEFKVLVRNNGTGVISNLSLQATTYPECNCSIIIVPDRVNLLLPNEDINFSVFLPANLTPINYTLLLNVISNKVNTSICLFLRVIPTEELDEELMELKLMVEKLIKEVEQKIKEALEKGLDVTEAEKLLGEAKNLYALGEYKKALEKLERALRLIITLPEFIPAIPIPWSTILLALAMLVIVGCFLFWRRIKSSEEEWERLYKKWGGQRKSQTFEKKNS
jgi:hypothetical protein